MDRKTEIFFEVHKGNPREAGGSNEATQRAYEAMESRANEEFLGHDRNLSSKSSGSCPRNSRKFQEPVILDIGCGPGAQTIHLAKISGGEISAVDKHAPFLAALEAEAEAQGLRYQIDTVEAPMEDLPFEEGIFDIVWCEGAIYHIGFEKGLREWKKFLRPAGYMAVTDLCWLEKDPPAEPVEFWAEWYPNMKTVQENLEIIERTGYELIERFTIPDTDWWYNYYNHIKKRIAVLREKYRGDEQAETVFAFEETEMSMFEKYSRWYGYEFFIMQNTKGKTAESSRPRGGNTRLR